MKYGSRTCYGSKVVVKVKVFFVQTDSRQTNRQTKNYMPPESEIPGGHKKGRLIHELFEIFLVVLIMNFN